MAERLTQTQLAQVVAEVERLSQQQQAELDTTQVKEILQELSLPPALFDEAMVKIRQRDALVAQKQRHLKRIGVAAGLSILLTLGVFVANQRQQRQLAGITAQRDRLTFSQDNGGDLSLIEGGADELIYRLTLSDAPVGKRLSLSCSWTDPNGQIAHQNSYQTQPITTPLWNTFCRYTPGVNAPMGQWKVEAFLGDRTLSETTFEVQ